MIPVAVLTGFLGSGKTTLLRRVLADPRFARTAVIVNEFGAVGLDQDLIAQDLVASSDERIVALGTGCLCCAVRTDLVETLLDLDRRRRAGTVPGYARVVVETSGLADPAPILHALMTDAGLAAGHALDAVVTTVDAVHGAVTLERHLEARRQAAMADRIVLTKTDLARPAPALIDRLARLSPIAPVIRSAGAVDPADLFLTGGAAGVEALARALVRAGTSPGAPGPARALAAPVFAPRHDDGIAAVHLVLDRPPPAAALALFLQALADACGDRLLRLKGIVEVAERAGRPGVLHAVRHVLHPPEWLDGWPSADRRGRIVLIGRGIPPAWPGRLLDAILAEVADETARRTAG